MAKARKKVSDIPETSFTSSELRRSAEAAQPEQTEVQGGEQPDPALEFNPEELERQSQEQGNNAKSGQTFAEGASRNSWSKIPKAFAIETINAGDNVVHLYRSDKDRAFLIRMDKNPNEGRAQADPHPALAEIKQAGFRWREALADGKMAWGKSWQHGQFHFAEEQEARKLANKVAELLGPVRHEERIPD